MSVTPGSPAPAPASAAAAHRVAKAAAGRWADVPVKERTRKLAAFRAALVAASDEITRDSPREASEFIASELVPLADACRFLERNSARLLQPRRTGGRGRPSWLRGVKAEVRREPLGVVLVIAPSNYPLFLPGVAMLQSLAAGNGAVLKPGSGGAPAAHWLRELAARAGFTEGLVQVLEDTAESGRLALGCGFDKVLFTGSASTGREVLTETARTLTPATVELSGCDLALVLSDADLERAARAIAFGLALNGGCTCIAPRRLVVPKDRAGAFLDALRSALQGRASTALDARTAEKLRELANGAEPAVGGLQADGEFAPAVYTGLPEDHPLAAADIFAPVAVLLPYDDLGDALELANRCPYKLGASIFGPAPAAMECAERLDVGNVSVNDVIVPTADPRLPFPARGESGFGLTRGAEGLLALTRAKTVAVRGGCWLPHLDPPSPGDAEFLSGYLQLAHGARLRDRLAGLGRLKRALKKRNTKKTNNLEQ